MISFTNSLVNFSSSILKYYGITPFHPSIKEIDDILNRHKNKKIAVILFDGLSKVIKEKHLTKNDALIKKSKIEITSVFPPTTVAATTSFLTGKYPCETGWLGWCQYFKEQNVTLDMFSNKISNTEEVYTKPLSYELLPYKTILDLINEKGQIKAYSLYPHHINNGEAKNLPHFFELLNLKMKNNSEQFLYGYWTDPDSTIHAEGVSSNNVHSIIKYINKHVTNLAKKNPDTLIFIIADHGLVDIVNDSVFDYPDLLDTLITLPCLDSRSSFFFVKDGLKEKFKTLFNKYYGQNYYLKTKTEIINEKIFGDGILHPLFHNLLGDYLAISKNNHAFDKTKNDDFSEPMVAAHAGMSDDEFLISVAIFNDK